MVELESLDDVGVAGRGG